MCSFMADRRGSRHAVVTRDIWDTTHVKVIVGMEEQNILKVTTYSFIFV